jgi:hypothetical protein
VWGCRLFSEAGNYCPEEVELFSRKLDRLAGKLSGAGPQALAAVAEASSLHSQTALNTFSLFQNRWGCVSEGWGRVFCPRYQLHWTDMAYLEEVKRSLTSLQVSLRTVVANSNRQARQLHDDITRLKGHLEVSEAAASCVILLMSCAVWRPHPPPGGCSPCR